MKDPLEAIFGTSDAPHRPFPENSRYAGLETAVLKADDGTETVYLRRRFVPQPSRFATLREHTVVQGDRLDNIAALYLGDPEKFWLICDANGAVRPDELTESPGRRLRITLPADIAGATGA